RFSRDWSSDVCSSDLKVVQRVFISEDLDKRNRDPTKMFVTVKGWKILENCSNTELPEILSEQLLDSAHRLPPQDISGKAKGSSRSEERRVGKEKKRRE